MVCQTLRLWVRLRTDNVNIPKKITSPVINKIQKLTLAKPVTPKNSVKENSVKFMRQGFVRSHDKLNLYTHGYQSRQAIDLP